MRNQASLPAPDPALDEVVLPPGALAAGMTSVCGRCGAVYWTAGGHACRRGRVLLASGYVLGAAR